MKSKIFKYAMMSILFLLTIFCANEVKAEKYTGQAIWPSEYISNIYIRKDRPDGYKKYQQARFIRRSEDNKFVYCLQPYVEIDNNLPYYDVIRSDYEQVLGLSKAQWQRVSLLAYYGYKYTGNGVDHTDTKWYAITAVMIWRTVAPDSDIYFTDTLNGNKISRFESEMAEIERLVANHYKTPSFEKGIVMPVGTTIEINDANNIANEFKIKDVTSNINATLNGNKLSITAKATGDAKITLEKTDAKYETPPIVYFSDHSQNVFRVGRYDPVPASFELKIVGGRTTTHKTDAETKEQKPQGEATLEGAVYGIYRESDNQKVSTVTTDKNGNVTSDYLPSLGKFYLLEEKASTGYELDTTKYYFEITEDNLNPEVTVYEKVIKLTFDITKVYTSDKTGIMTPEANVKFGFYNNKGELVKEATTSEDGSLKVTLPYGTYTVKQLTSTHNYEKAEDFTIEVKTSGKDVRMVISNKEITARLKVIKIDADTKEVIERKNIKFKIFNVDTNKYVCQTITYPTAKTICEYETDDKGILITPYPLASGKYKLEEIDQKIDGYLWNKESQEFEIGEDANLITDNEYGVLFETKFENKEVKGIINIHKTGEELVIDNNKYSYKEINLEGVKYNLYAKEDIYSASGKLKYKKDSLVGTITTDIDGLGFIDNLYLGSYYLVEQNSVNNNMIDSTKHEITLKYKDQYTPTISTKKELKNYLPKGTLDFTKTDISESLPLPNTTITIYNENDEVMFIGKTDENGKIVINDLPLGKYYILETEAPEGYLLNPEKMWFELKENGEIVKSIMKDEIIKVPSTGINDYHIIDIVGLVFIFGGVAFIIYDKKRKK